MTTYRLHSSGFWYAPGMMQNVLHMEKTGDGVIARNILKAYKLPEEVVEKFLSGEIKHTVEGDVVLLEVTEEEVAS
jgi:predicted RNA-binding protein